MKGPHRALAAAVVLGIAPSAIAGREPAAAASFRTTTTEAAAQLTPADAAALIDGFVPYALARGDIAGAVIVVVKNGQVLVARRYGEADRKTHRPIDIERTMFRQGSVSKLLTWTAVLQLVDAGKLDLDRDINAYLDFPVPSRFGHPITLRNLMTHTAGFAETYRELMTPNRSATPTLENYVKRHLPARIYAPGTTIAYSNYGATLAGYIVQRVSGERFEDYAARHIFTPLGMHHSTFEQPPRGDMASGYLRASEQPYPFEFAGDVPAGGLSASAADMARFMIAHLGRAGSAALFSPATMARMHATAFRQIPSLHGMALGFYEEDRNGRRVIGHAGDLISFHTDLHLLPGEGVGIYIAMNSWGRDDASSSLRRAFFERFMDRYYPGTALPAASVTAGSRERAQALVGSYASNRRSVGDLGTLIDLFGQGSLEANDDGTIRFSKFHDEAGEPKRWREVRPSVWRDVNGSAMLAVVNDGQAPRLYVDDQPPVFTYVRVSPWQSAAWRLPVLGLFIAIMALSALAWPLGAGMRWCNRASVGRVRPKAERWTARTAAVGNAVFAGGWISILAAAGTHPSMLGPGLDPWLRLLQVSGLVAAFATIAFATLVGRRMRRYGTSGRSVLTDGLLIVAGLGIAFFAFDYHLFNFSLRY